LCVLYCCIYVYSGIVHGDGLAASVQVAWVE